MPPSYLFEESVDNERYMDKALEISEFAKKNSQIIDKENRFPIENFHLLKQHGFMGLIIPKEYGGLGLGYEVMVEISKILSAGCLSTGMMWSMHCQQVAILVNHASEQFKQMELRDIAENGFLIGSVTTEKGKGADLLRAQAPLKFENDNILDHILLDRLAPVVSGGLHCDAYLISMRKDDSARETDVKLVYVRRSQLEIEQISDWNTMGMRGTNSVSLDLKGNIRLEQIINPTQDFLNIATITQIPIALLTWAASWLGGVQGVYRSFRNLLKDPTTKQHFNVSSDLLMERLGRIRLKLDTVESYLRETLNEYEKYRNHEMECLFRPAFRIKVNNVKILASEQLFEIVNDLMNIAGLKYGYSENKQLPLERLFRDIRSASLMYHNDKLLIASGKLSLMD
ncbi:acyl-CoA/acyl-ACP dehydrogenase [Paenibacillus filicis]|uniref:Acyl-CoA/acyl-ACP dehydrogenase n=1 Tax=Paenibacillus gyeongsangnamensis TaxID=3388067 RepID=A0ABT4Q8C4_9BACL|nr:acyl-CoA dehydrogenase family protein [Paenibacillus filicis]MCZ8513128.1 acyl-CoA/acyl-ACP dehydrogenase [Paenibacillus filicis]